MDIITTADLPVGAEVRINRTGAANGATKYVISGQEADGFTYKVMEGHSGRNLMMIRKHEHVALTEVVAFVHDGWMNLPQVTGRKAARYPVSPLGFPAVKVA